MDSGFSQVAIGSLQISMASLRCLMDWAVEISVRDIGLRHGNNDVTEAKGAFNFNLLAKTKLSFPIPVDS